MSNESLDAKTQARIVGIGNSLIERDCSWSPILFFLVTCEFWFAADRLSSVGHCSSRVTAARLIMRRLLFVTYISLFSCLCLFAGPPHTAHYDGANWRLKGDGIVCCPCTVPCPCRNNAAPSYGHCEATLYLRIKQGHYGTVNLDGMQVIDSGGMCAVSYSRLSALYFDASASATQQSALMKLIASFSPEMAASFPHVRVVHFNSQVTDDRLFHVSIPGILEMIVDRNWGLAEPPMPIVAAPDHFSNTIQYAQNLRYRIHDPEAELDFDYSHRQANYRAVDLAVGQYRSKSMLIQFANGQGWFTPQQMELIRAQQLAVPQIDAIRREALRLREARPR